MQPVVLHHLVNSLWVTHHFTSAPVQVESTQAVSVGERQYGRNSRYIGQRDRYTKNLMVCMSCYRWHAVYAVLERTIPYHCFSHLLKHIQNPFVKFWLLIRFDIYKIRFEIIIALRSLMKKSTPKNEQPLITKTKTFFRESDTIALMLTCNWIIRRVTISQFYHWRLTHKSV